MFAAGEPGHGGYEGGREPGGGVAYPVTEPARTKKGTVPLTGFPAACRLPPST